MIWNGRFDGDEVVDLRLWQCVKQFDGRFSKKQRNFAFVGFSSDEGVRRNLGRLGAKEGPDAIRKALSSIPILRHDTAFCDFNNTVVEGQNLEQGQQAYSQEISRAIDEGFFPIGLGGGHEIAIGTFNGIKDSKKYKGKKIGIINFDAHLDMRSYEIQPTSGTSFKQIADSYSPFKYMIIGFQEIGNTRRLIDLANKHHVKMLSMEEVARLSIDALFQQVETFIKEVDCLYVSFCMDVFDASHAPGVSAPAAVGIDKMKVIELFDRLLKTSKIAGVDVAEVNPSLDIDNRTAKLAAFLIHRIIK